MVCRVVAAFRVVPVRGFRVVEAVLVEIAVCLSAATGPEDSRDAAAEDLRVALAGVPTADRLVPEWAPGVVLGQVEDVWAVLAG